MQHLFNTFPNQSGRVHCNGKVGRTRGPGETTPPRLTPLVIGEEQQ